MAEWPCKLWISISAIIIATESYTQWLVAQCGHTGMSCAHVSMYPWEVYLVLMVMGIMHLMYESIDVYYKQPSARSESGTDTRDGGGSER